MSGEPDEVDLVVVGAGAGGLAAARVGVRAGLQTTMVAAGPVGGTARSPAACRRRPCSRRRPRGRTRAPRWPGSGRRWLALPPVRPPKVLRGEGVEVIEGRARLVSPREVEIAVRGATRRCRAPSVVLATGASPRLPPVAGLGGVDVLTTETVFNLPAAPGSMVVLGGGPVGCELAQAFARLGTRVTLVQSAPRLLPAEEPDAGAVLADVLRREGVEVRLGAQTTEVASRPGGGVRLGVDGGPPVEADRLLVATGRRPDTEGLGLAQAGVPVGERGEVVVDDYLATAAPGVWAVGDVTALSPYTHAADEMGRLAVRNATVPAWRRSRFDPGLVPHVTFTKPEVASIGLGEAAAAAAHGDGAWVAHLPMSAVDRAVAAGRTEGFVRLVAGPQPGLGLLARHGLASQGGGRVLGAAVVAERAGEVLAEIALVMRIGAFTGRLAQTVHAYPTWTLAARQAAAALATGDGPARRARRHPQEVP